MSDPLASLRPILNIQVIGTPRPKGSMRHVGKGRMIEQLADSPTWRRTVAGTAYEAIRAACHDDSHHECTHLQPGYPFTGAVKVLVRLEFVRPKSVKAGGLPSTRSTGDIDKHMRNIFDALQDAGVFKDDAQIVDQCSSKRYSVTGVAGAVITVWPAPSGSTQPTH
jgi:crossover junction endodeoxyribonuclease RusA